MWRRDMDVPVSGKSKRGPPVNMVMNFLVINWATTVFWRRVKPHRFPVLPILAKNHIWLSWWQFTETFVLPSAFRSYQVAFKETNKFYRQSKAQLLKWVMHTRNLLFKKLIQTITAIPLPPGGITDSDQCRRSRWQRGTACGSAAARLLRMRVRIPPGACMSFSCECCLLSGTGLCDGTIPRPEDSYWVCVTVNVH